MSYISGNVISYRLCEPFESISISNGIETLYIITINNLFKENKKKIRKVENRRCMKSNLNEIPQIISYELMAN